MPSITTLPPRAGAFNYHPDDVAEVHYLLLEEVRAGQGVQIEDEGCEKESTARLRVGNMQKCLLRDYGVKVRAHVVPLGGENKKGEAVGPFMPVVSLPRQRGDKAKDAADGANEMTGEPVDHVQGEKS